MSRKAEYVAVPGSNDLSRRRAAATGFPDLGGTCIVGLEFGHFIEALSQTLQQLVVERRLGGGQGVMAPNTRLADHDQVGLPKIGQMTRNARLGSTKALHNVADTKFAVPQNVQNPQSRPVGERPEHQVNRILRLCLRGLRHRGNCRADLGAARCLGTHDTVTVGYRRGSGQGWAYATAVSDCQSPSPPAP